MRLAVCIFAFLTMQTASNIFYDYDKPEMVYNDVRFSSSKHFFKAQCLSLTQSLIHLKREGMTLDVKRYECNGRQPRKLGSAIFVIGGPYQSISPLPDPFISTLMIAGYDVYVPIYSGTFGHTIAQTKGINRETIKGGGELATAAAEVALAAKWLTDNKKESGEKLVMVGESAGGYISSLACQIYCTPNLLLVSPLIQSPEEFWSNYAKTSSDRKIFYRYSGTIPKNEEEDLDAAKLAAIGFYGLDFRNTRLISLLDEVSPKIKKRIFIGDRDPRIGVIFSKELEKASVRLNAGVSFFPDMRHGLIQSSPHGEEQMIKWLRSL